MHLLAVEMKMVKDLNQLLPVTLSSAHGRSEERELPFLTFIVPKDETIK